MTSATRLACMSETSTERCDLNLDYSMMSMDETNASSSSSPPWRLNDSNATLLADPAVQHPPDPYIRYLNVSMMYPLEYAVPFLGYMMPFLLVVTIIANTLIVVVLCKRHMRNSTNTLLTSMALSDMFTLLVPYPWLFYLYTLGNHSEPLSPIFACYAFVYMHEVIPAFFHTASIWLTLALAVQRYVSVCHPPTAFVWCTLPCINKGILVIYVLAGLHQSTRLFDRVMDPIEITWNDQLVTVCKETTAPWVMAIDENVYYGIYFWFRVIFVHVVPCTALVVLNVLLFKAIRDQQRNRLRLKVGCKSECKKQREANCTTLMLIVVVTVFLAVETPLAVITLLHIVSSSFNLAVLNYRIANVLILFTNFFIIVSYPINFAIYCGMSRDFRETFKALFVSAKDFNSRRDEGSSRYSVINGPHRAVTNDTGV